MLVCAQSEQGNESTTLLKMWLFASLFVFQRLPLHILTVPINVLVLSDRCVTAAAERKDGGSFMYLTPSNQGHLPSNSETLHEFLGHYASPHPQDPRTHLFLLLKHSNNVIMCDVW
jgi:hypothetical protein